MAVDVIAPFSGGVVSNPNKGRRQGSDADNVVVVVGGGSSRC